MNPVGTPIDIITLYEVLKVNGEEIILYRYGFEDRFSVESTEHIWND